MKKKTHKTNKEHEALFFVFFFLSGNNFNSCVFATRVAQRGSWPLFQPPAYKTRIF